MTDAEQLAALRGVGARSRARRGPGFTIEVSEIGEQAETVKAACKRCRQLVGASFQPLCELNVYALVTVRD